MSLEHHFACPLTNGVHARPASALEEVARVFASDVLLVNERTNTAANVKSVLALVGADIRHNDPCLLKISGPDEREAMTALSRFLRDTFPHCDDSLPALAKANGELRLPPGLQKSGVTVRRGIAVVPGIAQGRVVQIGRFSVPKKLLAEAVSNPTEEWERLDVALQKLIASCDVRLAQAERGLETELLKALRSILRDVEFRQVLQNAVIVRRRTAGSGPLPTRKRTSPQS